MGALVMCGDGDLALVTRRYDAKPHTNSDCNTLRVTSPPLAFILPPNSYHDVERHALHILRISLDQSRRYRLCRLSRGERR